MGSAMMFGWVPKCFSAFHIINETRTFARLHLDVFDAQKHRAINEDVFPKGISNVNNTNHPIM